MSLHNTICPGCNRRLFIEKNEINGSFRLQCKICEEYGVKALDYRGVIAAWEAKFPINKSKKGSNMIIYLRNSKNVNVVDAELSKDDVSVSIDIKGFIDLYESSLIENKEEIVEIFDNISEYRSYYHDFLHTIHDGNFVEMNKITVCYFKEIANKLNLCYIED